MNKMEIKYPKTYSEFDVQAQLFYELKSKGFDVLGNDNTAELIMSREAWEAFINGEKININTHISKKK